MNKILKSTCGYPHLFSKWKIQTEWKFRREKREERLKHYPATRIYP
jgi:hypothetical protein